MNNHYIKKCKECGTVVSQCRCYDKNKPIILVICDKCKEKKGE